MDLIIKIVLLIFLFLTSAKAKQKLVISLTEFCPYMCPSNKNKGFNADIVQAALELKNYEIEFVTLPWARAVDSGNKGIVDGILSPAIREAPKLIFPKEEVAIQKECFFGPKDDQWKPSLKKESFLNRTTIVFKGWTFEKYFKQKMNVHKYEQFFEEFSFDDRYLDRAFIMLKQERAQSFWQDPLVYQYYVNMKKLPTDLEIAQKGCLESHKLYLGLSPINPLKSKQIAKDFDEGIKELRRVGLIKEILKKYNITDWK